MRLDGEDLFVKFSLFPDIVWMTTMFIFGVIAAIYVGFNLFVTRRINTAFYMDEERRRFHKNLSG